MALLRVYHISTTLPLCASPPCTFCRFPATPLATFCHLPPQGRNVVLETKFGSPKIVNDGVTIAREVRVGGLQTRRGAERLHKYC